jgi:glucosamine--fructose-6-phosphate aminotransferase (isomerizing)
MDHMVKDHEPGSFLKSTLERQPQDLRRLLADGSAVSAAERLEPADRIFLVGTGTSYHGALAGQFILRSAGKEAWAVRAFEFANYPPDLKDSDALILLSHRGSKRFSVAALDLFKVFGERWIAITGEGSKLEGDGVVRTVEQETSPVHTASHTGAMLRLAQVACALGAPVWRSQVDELPAAVGEAVALRDQVAGALTAMDLARSIHFVGGGPARANAYEGALKIREAAHRVIAEGHELEGLLQGPLISLQPDHSVVLMAQPGPSLARTREVAEALKDIGTTVLAVGPAAGSIAASYQVATPLVDEALSPIVNVVPLQWLAYEASKRLGVDADSFRRDEERYAAAQARFAL